MKTKEISPAASKPKKILIVDDHPLMRDGLAALISAQADLAVCGQAAECRAAVHAVESLRPDLVLMDISLPGKGGMEIIKEIHAVKPDLAVLAISMHDEALYAERVLRAGARGYIMKQEGGKRIMVAIRAVLAGRVFVSEKMSARIMDAFSGQHRAEAASPVSSLSAREFEVFGLLGQGLSTKDIATQLHLSIKTVEVHRVNIKTKLKVATSPELIRYAVRWDEAQAGAGL